MIMLVVTCLIQIITPLVLVIYVIISRKDEIPLNISKLSQISFFQNWLNFQVSLSLWDTSEPWGFDYREEQVKILGPVRSLDFFWTNQAEL